MNNKNNKDIFLDIEDQINHLKDDRNLIISDEAKLTEYLKKHNYEFVINSMLNPSILQTKNNYKFIDNFTSCGLLSIFDFDREICSILFQELLEIENKISTAIVYVIPKYFTDKNNINYIAELENGQILKINENDNKWSIIFPNNKYQDGENKVSHNLLKKYNTYTKNGVEKSVFSEYLLKPENVPIWKLSINWTFKTIINIFSALDPILKHQIINFIFNQNIRIKNKEFHEIIIMFNKLRNRVCHNNSVYNAIFSDDWNIVKNFLKKKNFKVSRNIFLKDIINLINIFNPNSKIFEKIEKSINNFIDMIQQEEIKIKSKINLKLIKNLEKFKESIEIVRAKSYNKKTQL